MKKIRVNDFLAIGLILISIFLIASIYQTNNQIINTVGLIGSIITIIAELVYLWQEKLR